MLPVQTALWYHLADVYDPETNTWAAASAPNLQAKSNGGYNNYNFMIWTGDRVFVAGGSETSTATSRHEGFYNPNTNTWSYSATDYFYDNYGMSNSLAWTGDSVVHSSGSYLSVVNLATNSVSKLNNTSTMGMKNFIWTGRDLISCYGNSSSATDGTCKKLNLETHNHWLSLMNYDSWTTNLATASAPIARSGASSIWTGKYFIVWGGTDGSTYLNSGHKYDPFRNTWTAISTTGAPTGRINHASIWAGNKMIVWGGQTAAGTQSNTGAIYDVDSDTWSAMSTSGAPSAREEHSVVWTGGRMLLWGGQNAGAPLGDGFIYNPTDNSWSTMATTGAPPSARSAHQALWTGSKMIIWGGADGAGTLTNTGAVFELSTNTWSALATLSAPVARRDFSMILSKDKFVVWGGVDSIGGALNSGAIYDLTLNTWTTASTTGAPSARSKASTAYTDRSMIVWGGVNGSTNYSDGFLFNPQTNVWSTMATSGLTERYGAMAAWIGGVGDGLGRGSHTYKNNFNGDTGRLIIWGGFDGTTYKADGKIYALPNQ